MVKPRRIGIIIGLILAFLLVFGALFINSIGSSSGQHTGIVTAVEHNSNIVFAANLVYFKTSTTSTQEDIYCVNDPSLRTQLEGLASNQTTEQYNIQTPI